jgi:hypothetical protein
MRNAIVAMILASTFVAGELPAATRHPVSLYSRTPLAPALPARKSARRFLGRDR